MITCDISERCIFCIEDYCKHSAYMYGYSEHLIASHEVQSQFTRDPSPGRGGGFPVSGHF